MQVCVHQQWLKIFKLYNILKAISKCVYVHMSVYVYMCVKVSEKEMERKAMCAKTKEGKPFIFFSVYIT